MSDPYSLTILTVPPNDRHQFKLAKTFKPADDGRLARVDYSAGMSFQFRQHRVATLAEFLAIMRKLSNAPHACVIRGEPIAGLNPQNARRLQSNFPDVPRHHLFVDFDNPTLPRGEAGAYAARELLPEPFHTAPCWWQRTGSYGVDHTDRDAKDDPWRSRIRLGFMLDKPLTAPQIKYWLREHRKIADLAIYTSNQITYTAAPVFVDGASDPVADANEERLGIIDLDDALVEEVIVPDEIATYEPKHIGTTVTTRPATISGPKHQRLVEDAEECDAQEGERHGTVTRWVFDAYGLGMDEREIIDIATRTLERLGRDPAKARPEAARMVAGAQRKAEDGTLTVSTHLNASADFDPVDPDDPDNGPGGGKLTPAQAQAQTQALINWWDKLKVSPSTGAFKNTIDNAAIILHNHSSMQADGGCILAYDAFRDMPVWTAPPPWWRSVPEKARPPIGALGAPVTEADAIACCVWLGHLDPASGPEGTPIHLNKGVIFDALVHVARYRTVNPVREYLDQAAEAWDKVDRLGRVLIDVCHAPATDIVPIWFKKWMIQAVARAYKPGSKCDGVLVFQGGQGAKKSTFFRNLCPFPEVFFEGTINFRDKDAMQEVQGKLIVELSEMSGTKKDVDVLKGYITKQDDTYRASYGLRAERHPRTMIFCGTTNDDDALVDTGGRRWWVVAIPDADEGSLATPIDLERVIRERQLWWGEAVHAYRNGDEWWLDPKDDARSREIAIQHSAGLEMSAAVNKWADTSPENGGPAHPDLLLPVDIWTGPLGKPLSSWHGASGREVARVMLALPEWKRVGVRLSAQRKMRVYARRGSKMAVDSRALRDYLLHQSASNSAQPAA